MVVTHEWSIMNWEKSVRKFKVSEMKASLEETKCRKVINEYIDCRT